LPLVRQLFRGRPVLYGTVIWLFESLRLEYDAIDAIPTSRFDKIHADVPAVLAALDAEFDAPPVLLRRLNELHEAWYDLG
jgi:hypothetical protein